MRSFGRRRSSVRSDSATVLPFRITNVTPSSVNAGAGATAIDVAGIDFTGTATIYVDGVAQTTTRVSALLLQCTVASGVTAVPGFKSIQVRDALDQASNTWQWPVNFPVPTLASVSPTFGYALEGNVSVSGTGTGIYAVGTDAAIDGADAASSFVDSTHMNVTVPSSIVNVVGDYAITLTNPAPGGGASEARTFQARYRAPTFTSINPTGIPIDSGDTPVVCAGSNLYPASQVWLDGDPLTGTFVNSGRIDVVVPAAVTAVAGNKTLQITTPTTGGGGGASATKTFAVGYQTPVINSISPVAIPFNASATIVVESGDFFYPASVVRVDGVDQATTFIDSSHVSFSYSPTIVTTLNITVFNPTSGGGGGESNAKVLTITGDLTSLSPSTKRQYAPTFTATLGGAGFTATTLGRINGHELVTIFDSSTQIRCTVPANRLYTAGANIFDIVDVSGGVPSPSTQTLTLTAFDPGLNANGAAKAYRADDVGLDPIVPTDVLVLNDRIGSVDFVNLTNQAQNPPYVASDTGINFKPSVDFNGTNEILGVSSFPLCTALWPSGDWTNAYVVRIDSCSTNAANPYDNVQVISSDSNPGVRIGLAVKNNAGTYSLVFWMFDGSFKTVASTNVTVGAWHQILVKKVGTTLSISVNGQTFVNTSSVNNLSATTQRTRIGASYPGAGKYLDGRFAEADFSAGGWVTDDYDCWPNYVADRYAIV